MNKSAGIFNTKHYLVTGLPGSGKSSLSKRLARKMKLPRYELDKHPNFRRSMDLLDEGREAEAYKMQRAMVQEALALKKPHVIEGQQLLLAPDLLKNHYVRVVNPPKSVVESQWAKREAKKHITKSSKRGLKTERYYRDLYNTREYPFYASGLKQVIDNQRVPDNVFKKILYKMRRLFMNKEFVNVRHHLEKRASPMTPIDLMMKTATTDFLGTVSDLMKAEEQGPLVKKFRKTITKPSPTLRDYRRFLVSQTKDPKLGTSATAVLSALDGVSKKDAGLLKSVRLLTDKGESLFDASVSGSSIRATQDRPQTLAHELQHRIFHEGRGDVDSKGVLTNKGRDKRLDAFDRRMNAKTQRAYTKTPFFKRLVADVKGETLPGVTKAMKRHETLAGTMRLKDTITSESDANRGAINALLGKRSLDAASPKEKKQILKTLVGMTTYYESDPRSSYSKGVKLQEQSKPNLFPGSEFKQNPFSPKDNAWKNMNRKQRMGYIQQIKLNRKHIEASMPQGKKMGKLYMKGMMKALRSRL